MLMRSGGSRHVTMPIFLETGPSIADIAIFKMPLPPCSIFEIAKFYWLTGSIWSRRTSMPNFVKIGQSVAKD